MSYASVLRAKLDSKRDVFPRRRGISSDMIDAAAEREFLRRTAGTYRQLVRLRKEGACPVCFEVRASNGSCSC